MQVPKDSISTDLDLSSVYAGIEYSPEHPAGHSVISDASNYQPNIQNSARASSQTGSGQTGGEQTGGGQTGWHWQMGTALTGTVIVSAGLALPFIGKQAITVPVGEFVPPEQTSNGSFTTTQPNGQTSQQVALNQGEGISPQVGQTSQAAFSASTHTSSTNTSNTHTSSTHTSSTHTGTSPQAAQGTAYNTASFAEPLLAQQADGSWSLSGNAPSSGPAQAAFTRPTAASATQPDTTRLSAPAIVSQLAAAVTGSEPVCLGNSCRGLAYIQVQLPKAQQTVESIQQQLNDFASQHAQGDITAYQQVLADRLSEVSEQESRLAIELVETDRYATQIETKLAALSFQTDLARNLLSADTGYQTEWLRLKQMERQLLAEYSKANIDATPLNEIYREYEEQQQETYAAAEAVLGNYLMAKGKSQVGQPLSIYSAPAALDILQALTVSLHQQDTQQLRHSTLKIAEENLQRRQKTLAQDLSKYESLQQELRTATALVQQYEQTRAQIGTEAATTATASAVTPGAVPAPATAIEQDSPAIEIAKTLEKTMPDGSLGKTILGIVIAAGAVAVAAQRRTGDVSKALASVNLKNSDSRDLSRQALNRKGFNVSISPRRQPVSAEDTSPTDNLAIEIMSRELDEILSLSTAESFEQEKQDRAIASIQLPIDKIDAFAESAVRWVLKDLSNTPGPTTPKTSEPSAASHLSLKAA